ncbi:MAG: DUF4998 domain-containing protein [Tannerella sp.]|nr:DUF4998 domain-containing protein [Tannerella sp.]
MKIITVLIILTLFIGCDDMNNINQEYIDRGETIYTGVVDSIEASPGYNRVRVNWFINSDPRVKKTVIYWNEGKDSTVVQITRQDNIPTHHELTFSVPEGAYVFQFVTKDNEGHHSVNTTFSEISVSIYGDRYIAGLSNRPVASINTTKITWGDVESVTILYTTVSYVDDEGVKQVIKVENDSTETPLPGAQAGTDVSVVTTFIPVNGLDEVNALPRVYTL